MVIVDPVDKGRNVASAVQPVKLYDFMAASRAFLETPSNAFFFPSKTAALPLKSLKSEIESRGSSTLFLVVDQVPAVPDVLWGQLYRTKRSLHKLIELSDYKIIKESVWSNEKSLSVFVYELEQQVLPNIKKHLGPPLEREAECESFLAKYTVNDQVISGPTVEDGRWVVLLPRKTTDIITLLLDKLADGGKNAGVADLIAESIRKKLRVMVNGEIGGVYSENVDFAVFLTEFFSGRPLWLN
jgi:tRNA nucleotidyltransferase (CCA-adding enzyme)